MRLEHLLSVLGVGAAAASKKVSRDLHPKENSKQRLSEDERKRKKARKKKRKSQKASRRRNRK